MLTFKKWKKFVCPYRACLDLLNTFFKKIKFHQNQCLLLVGIFENVFTSRAIKKNRFKFAFFISFFTDFCYSKTSHQTWLTLCATCAAQLMAWCLSVIWAHPVNHLTIRKKIRSYVKNKYNNIYAIQWN